MALIDRMNDDSGARSHRLVSDRSHFGEIAATLFVAVLMLAAFAPAMVTAAVGALLLGAGLLMAAVLWTLGWPRSEHAGAWDIAALGAFLGFAATLLCNVGIANS